METGGKMVLEEVIQYFGIDGVIGISEVNDGHINSTFHVECRNGESYILQSLNRSIFHSPGTVMSNIKKIEKAFADSSEEKVTVPHYLLTADGANYVEEDDNVYRMYKFVGEKSGISDRFYMTGFSFGTFIRKLGRKNIRLEAAIDNFHSFQGYFSLLTAADKSSPFKKIDNIVMGRLDSLRETLEQVFTVDFPRRNVHNDAKISNVILGEQCTVIDLDTAMEGYAAIDYGDMIRSVCSAEELDFTVIRDITRGFADGLEGALTDDEIYSLYYGILYVTGELAVRYLIDYLSEEKYFKDKSSAACLSRANELLRQLSIFISAGDEITSIIYKTFKKQ